MLKVLGLFMAVFVVSSAPAHACQDWHITQQAFNQAVKNADFSYASDLTQATIDLDTARLNSKTAYQKALDQAGDDHSAETYNTAVIELNRANSVSEAKYETDVQGAIARRQAVVDRAAADYNSATCR